MMEFKRCQLSDCNRAASTLCYCCQKSICTRHFTEHMDAIRAQVDPLADVVNIMVEKIRDVTIEQSTEIPFGKLNQWKCDMHQLIDEIFSSRCKEIEDLVEKNKEKFLEYKTQQWDNVMKIQEEVKQLVEDGDATFQQIESLKKQLARIEESQSVFEKNFISIHTQVSGHGFVTVSSTLIDSNTPSRLVQSSITDNPTFPAAIHQPSRLQTTHSIHSFDPKVLFSGDGLGELKLSQFSSGSAGYNQYSNPFAVAQEKPGCRPVVKARRRKP